MTGRRLLVGTAVLVIAVASSCNVATQDQADVIPDDAVPFELLDRNSSPIVPTSVPGAETDPTELCFVRDGRLVIIVQRLAAPAKAADLVTALATPPTDLSPPPRTAVTNTGIIKDVTVAAGVARIDLRESFGQLGGEEQLLAVAQIVCTLTGRAGVGQVAFQLEGAPIEVPRGDGSLVAHPVSRDDYATLLE